MPNGKEIDAAILCAGRVLLLLFSKCSPHSLHSRANYLMKGIDFSVFVFPQIVFFLVVTVGVCYIRLM
jgi:hypothetical protein